MTFLIAHLLALFCVVCFLLKVQGQLQAEFLVATPRNTSSGYYDLYYSCNVCGGGTLWIVDGEDAAIHRMTSTSGDVDFYRRPGDSTTLRYVSIVLSRRVKDGGQVCLDSVLVVSQPEPFSEKKPSVRCTGGPFQQTVRYPSSEIEDPVIIDNGTVAIEQLLEKSNIVVPGSNFTTHVLGCRSRGIPQTWKRNEMVEAVYSTTNMGTGAKVSQVYSSNSSVVRVVTVLLERQTGVTSDEVYSILVWTDIASTPSPANVTCVSSNPSEYAYTTVPQSDDDIETLTTIENTPSDSTTVPVVTKNFRGISTSHEFVTFRGVFTSPELVTNTFRRSTSPELVTNTFRGSTSPEWATNTLRGASTSPELVNGCGLQTLGS